MKRDYITMGVAVIALILAIIAFSSSPTIQTKGDEESDTLAKIRDTGKLDVCYAEYPPAVIKDPNTGKLSGHSIDTIEAVENARAKGIKIISITDKIISPITKFSNVVFTAQTNNIVFVNTVSSVLVIIYALAAGVGLTDRTTSLKAISSFEKAKSEFGFDVHSEFFK